MPVGLSGWTVSGWNLHAVDVAGAAHIGSTDGKYPVHRETCHWDLGMLDELHDGITDPTHHS